MLRLLRFLLIAPFAIALILFGVANRHGVTLLVDPISPAAEALKITVPLFLFFFATLALGVILGSMTTWFTQGRHRRAERLYRRERDRLADENARLKAQAAPAGTALAPAN